MNNPWIALPDNPLYVLPQDKPHIDAFNALAKRRGRDKHYIQLWSVPEPYLGRWDAPVVLLNLNPGAGDLPICWQAWREVDEARQAETWLSGRWRKNLLHNLEDYPFYLLHPDYKESGYCWWTKHLGRLLRHHGSDGHRVIANNLFCVEYFPYHSRQFRHHMLRVPSQEYSFHLVRQAMERGALIIQMRGSRLWESVMPELVDYERRYRLRHVQNAFISPRNCPEGYPKIIEVLDRAA